MIVREKSPMTPKEELMMAYHIASKVHFGQLDQGGVPYILHPIRVAQTLNTDDYQRMAIALLHDVVEDGKIPHHEHYQQLRDLGFSDRTIEGVRCLTKIPGETYVAYQAKVLSNYDSILVKIEDLEHNSDLERLKTVLPRDLERNKKYRAFLARLEAEKNRIESKPLPAANHERGQDGKFFR